MSLLREILATIQIKNAIDFGIHENVRLTNVDNTERTREGDIINKNTFLTFTKFSDKGESIASSEFSYFNLDPSSEYVLENLIMQISQLNNITNVLAGKSFDPVDEYESKEELVADLGTKKGCKKLTKNIWDKFSEALGDNYGPDSKLIRLKVVTNSSGKYLQLPKEATIVESMDVTKEESILKMSAYDIKSKDKGIQNRIKGDAPGEAPGSNGPKNLLGEL